MLMSNKNFMPQYVWNIAKGEVKQQTILITINGG
jgi:hypothetical protein